MMDRCASLKRRVTDDTTVLIIDILPATSSNQCHQSFPDMVSELSKLQGLPDGLKGSVTVGNSSKSFKTEGPGASCGCLGWRAQTNNSRDGDSCGPGGKRYQMGSIPEATSAEGSPGYIPLVADIDSLKV